LFALFVAVLDIEQRRFEMERELKNDLVCAWNEIEEAKTSLEQLSQQELKECLEDILYRLKNALHWLGKYVSEKDIIQDL